MSVRVEKTSVRVEKTSVRVEKTSVRVGPQSRGKYHITHHGPGQTRGFTERNFDAKVDLRTSDIQCELRDVYDLTAATVYSENDLLTPCAVLSFQTKSRTFPNTAAQWGYTCFISSFLVILFGGMVLT